MATSSSDAPVDGSMSRHDLVLAVIPVAFVVALLVGQLVSLSPRTALAGASLVGAAVLLDALFVHPPRPPARPGE